MNEPQNKPKFSIGMNVAVKSEQSRTFQIGTIINSTTTKPGQLGRQPGTIIYLIRIKQYIDENRNITNYEKPPVPVTTATEQEMQIVRKQAKK